MCLLHNYEDVRAVQSKRVDYEIHLQSLSNIILQKDQIINEEGSATSKKDDAAVLIFYNIKNLSIKEDVNNFNKKQSDQSQKLSVGQIVNLKGLREQGFLK
ncbi:unnamed protein product (macronuclear) [Paramecium tetraurelia]|uniref:Uncharacterized protein n=1 Tax=Paramecium tetraurelia TaxID=5888 RepID=A0D242_PARTE|nr:uncharacterized protein GSPATT00012615001 [Paramecium tetraurelia]CAK77109.1 unnamed protein product [Paramecium tetraurelia]|eukprot:XP_001444506.1 hypothetical protein (macronuclear) [Paramecium tetraurelia strain d4-2]